MGANKTDITKCAYCGVSRDDETFSGRYRNACTPCARLKSRETKFKKTGVMPKPKTEWRNGLRECTCCEVKKTEEEYSWRDTPSGSRILNSMCKECIRGRQKELSKLPQTRERMKISQQKHYYFGGGQRKARNAKYLKQYGITVGDKERMIEKNGGLCPICKTDDPGRFWTVDHCHRTGKVRGVICDKCNKMLGLANDNMGRLISAAHYLCNHYLDRNPVEGTPNVPKPDEELEAEEGE